jgi:transposase
LEKEGMEILFLPPYCSELNPIERLWSYVKLYWKKEMMTFKGDITDNEKKELILSICNQMTKYNINAIVNHIAP